MTLLIEATVNGVKKYISNEPVDFGGRFYDPYVIKMGSIKISSPKQHGGYAKLSFSDFTISPDFFDDEYPVSMYIDVKYVENGEVTKLLESTAHRSSIARDGISYKLYGSDYSEVLTSQAFTGTLGSIFQTYTGSSHLNLTLDASLARDPSPGVNYTASGELLDILSDIASFFSHVFYIKDNTLYLVDVKHELSIENITDFDYLVGAKYRDNQPYNLFKSGNYSIAGSYSYGGEYDISPVCHTTQSNIESAIQDVKDILESKKIQVSFPIGHKNINIGDRLKWVDQSLSVPVAIEILVSSITYNFDKFDYTCEGNSYKS